jgi:hypothetical protein
MINIHEKNEMLAKGVHFFLSTTKLQSSHVWTINDYKLIGKLNVFLVPRLVKIWHLLSAFDKLSNVN